MYNQLVSIIIPVFNRESIVKKTLDSIMSQSYKNWECVLVDDGSTDDTMQTLKSYGERDSRFKVFMRPQDLRKGANSCRNFGFLQSEGSYVNWFDSDDIMHDNFIQEKLDNFDVHFDAVLHKNRYANYELTRFRESKFKYTTSENLFYHYAIEDIELQTCCFMWKRDYLSNKQLFNEVIDRYQDNDFHIRMLALKPKLFIFNKCLATIRGGDGDGSQISSKEKLSKKKIIDRFNYLIEVLTLNSSSNKEQYKIIETKVTKKAIWSFYEVLKFEENFYNRISDLKANYGKLSFIYKRDCYSYSSTIKSHLYILYILIFGRSFFNKKALIKR